MRRPSWRASCIARRSPRRTGWRRSGCGTSTCSGPRQDPNSQYSAVIPRFIAALLKGDQPTIYGDGSQSRDFTFIDNVVQANLLAATVPGVGGRVYNCACGESLDLVTLLRIICDTMDVPFAPYFAPPRVGDIQHSWADISAAVRDLGYRVDVPVREGLQRTVAWYVQQHQRQTHGAPQRIVPLAPSVC